MLANRSIPESQKPQQMVISMLSTRIWYCLTILAMTSAALRRRAECGSAEVERRVAQKRKLVPPAHVGRADGLRHQKPVGNRRRDDQTVGRRLAAAGRAPIYRMGPMRRSHRSTFCRFRVESFGKESDASLQHPNSTQPGEQDDRLVKNFMHEMCLRGTANERCPSCGNRSEQRTLHLLKPVDTRP